MMNTEASLLRRIRWCVAIIIFGLFVSGVTAIPLQTELDLVTRLIGDHQDGISVWLRKVHDGLTQTYAQYPFMAYGTDWLAFGHLVIALAFCWAWREPVRYSGLFTFGLMACAAVVPWALIMGQLRGIPWGWRMIDCSFGVCGLIPLWIAKQATEKLKILQERTEGAERS